MTLPIERRALAWLAQLPPGEAEAVLKTVDQETLASLETWNAIGRRAQRPPEGDWRVWLVMAGRGFGKTRTGAEWVHTIARQFGQSRIALIGATMDEARAVMVEGASGLLATGDRAGCGGMPPEWRPSLGQVKWKSGAIATLYSAENPQGLRGPEHRYAWCDELGKWGAGGTATWDNLMLGLRQGENQRVLVTTTPQPGALLKALLADPATHVTRGRTTDNYDLPPRFVAAVTARYGGTRLGRQELDGELIEDVEGALWTRAMIERARGGHLPPPASLCSATSPEGGGLVRVVVAVDPPASATGDACGIVACGIDRAGHGHVIEDASVAGASPERWARAVCACAARWGADRVIAEANNGGEMVRSTLLAHDPGLPVKLVHASRGKGARAEPVALLYEAGRVTHCGAFPELEDQLCGMTPGGYFGPGRSPDRADALVWALTELMLRRQGEPRVRGFG
jgi:phage terminase large subunit-like protein